MKDDYLPQKGYKRLIVICLYILFGGAFAFIFGKYIFKHIAPFLCAYLFSAVTHSFIERVSLKLKINEKIICVAVITVLLMIISCLIFGIIQKLIYEGNRIIEYGTEAYCTIKSGANVLIDKICEILPLSDKSNGIATVSGYFWNMLDKLVGSVTEKIPIFIGYVISTLPQIIFTFVIFVISSYYFSTSYDEINELISGLIPEKILIKISVVKCETGKSAGKYLKAYLILMMITFAELFAGFLIIGVKNPIINALVIAFADMLPVIGLGMILVPWAVICFVSRNIKLGIGLIVIYILSMAIRQVIEPKIVGKSIGLHPLATLIGIYVGFGMFGIIGLFVFPILILMLNNSNVFYREKYNTDKNKNQP